MQSNYILGVRIRDYIIQEHRGSVEDALFRIVTLIDKDDNILKRGGKTCNSSCIREDGGNPASICVEKKGKTILLFLLIE